ncbi:MAG: hypothetical protein LBR07_07120 [Puniceicoccales bacterium]|jgi:hypothetical protein|nr:hypothetical protein [Puniceicoccales bacterium]
MPLQRYSKEEKSRKDPRRGDDRNLVIVDQDFGQPDLEDRMFLFWTRNKTTILAISGLLIAGAIAAILWFAAADFRLHLLQDEYTKTAATPDARLAFARANAGKPLAGVAALEAGDDLFKQEKYADAAGAYALAVQNLPASEKAAAAFAARAQLFLGFAKLNAKDAAGATAAIEQTARAANYPVTFRCRAIYTLALLAVERGNNAEARRWLDEVDRLDPQNTWAAEKQELIALVPSLLNAAATLETKQPPAPPAEKSNEAKPAADAKPAAKPAPKPAAGSTGL